MKKISLNSIYGTPAVYNEVLSNSFNSRMENKWICQDSFFILAGKCVCFSYYKHTTQ